MAPLSIGGKVVLQKKTVIAILILFLCVSVFMYNFAWDRHYDINSIPEQQLYEMLNEIPQIGPTLAQRIIDGRPYQRLTDIKEVEGIGDILYGRIQNHFRVKKGGL